MAITVSIAAHYVPNRVLFLARVLDGILEWDVVTADVAVVTQDLALADEPLMLDRVAKLEAKGYRVTYDRTHDLAHPWHLTWWHKQHLRRWFEQGGDPDDLFIYIEDDIGIGKANLDYFRSSLAKLKPHGMIPGFMRYERLGRDRISADFLGPDIVNSARRVHIDGQDYINPLFPYWAGFALDRELTAEYLASPSAVLESAETKHQAYKHSCRVLSAWGLCYENIPDGFTSRYVVPVTNLVPNEKCFVWHTAENYSRSKLFSFGTVKMENVFLPVAVVSTIKRRLWESRAFIRRIDHKIRVEWAKLRGARLGGTLGAAMFRSDGT